MKSNYYTALDVINRNINKQSAKMQVGHKCEFTNWNICELTSLKASIDRMLKIKKDFEARENEAQSM